MDLVVYDDEERRYVPWMVSLAAVVLTAVLAAGITLLFTRSSGADDGLGGVTAPQAATASVEPSPAQADAAATPDPTAAAPPAAAPSPAGESPAAPPAPAAGPGTPPACSAALLRADAALARSGAIEQALAEQTRIMDELLAERITADQALEQSLPVLTRGAAHRDLLDDEVAAYQQSRQSCPD